MLTSAATRASDQYLPRRGEECADQEGEGNETVAPTEQEQKQEQRICLREKSDFSCEAREPQETKGEHVEQVEEDVIGRNVVSTLHAVCLHHVFQLLTLLQHEQVDVDGQLQTQCHGVQEGAECPARPVRAVLTMTIHVRYLLENGEQIGRGVIRHALH